MVEKLREMANISFEEAKLTLERNNWDMLDAAIELERTGKTVKATNSYSTNGDFKSGDGKSDACARRDDSGFKKLWDWLVGLLKKSVTNKFEVQRDGDSVVVIPVLLLIVLLLWAPYTVIIVLMIGLLFKFRYSFRGEDLGKKEVNEVFDKAADYAENLRSYVDEGKLKGRSDDGDKDTDN